MRMRNHVAMALLLALAGCARTPKAPIPSGPQKPPTRSFRFAVIGKSVHPYWSEVELGVKAAGEKFGCQTEFFVPQKEDAGQQKARIEAYLASGVDGLAFAASDPSSVNEIIRKAVNQHLPCVALDSDAPDSGRLAYIGTDNRAAGKLAGETLIGLLKGKGTVAICTGSLTALNSRERIEGFKEALRTSPGIRIVNTFNDNEDATRAVTMAENALLAHPDLAAFYGVYAFNGPAAAKAVRAANKAGQVKIVCFDATPEHIQYIKEGIITATLAQRPYMMGWKSVELLYRIKSEGQERVLASLSPREDKKVDTGVDLVTSESLADYQQKLKSLGIPADF